MKAIIFYSQINGFFYCKLLKNYKKKCAGGNIVNTQTAKQFEGCTHITGSLRININNKTDEEELYSLRNIAVIKGYLEISQSLITSLNFFQNLKEIKGKLIKQKFSLVISNNENLAELWDSTNIKINKKRISIRGNSKLCANVIKKFLTTYYPLDATEKNISQSNNGDLAICNFTNLRTRLIEISSTIRSRVIF